MTRQTIHAEKLSPHIGAEIHGVDLSEPLGERYLAAQQYYVQMPSPVYVAVWDEALKNYGPNLGYDYGGRLLHAWLER
jgi:hypothetical protein